MYYVCVWAEIDQCWERGWGQSLKAAVLLSWMSNINITYFKYWLQLIPRAATVNNCSLTFIQWLLCLHNSDLILTSYFALSFCLYTLCESRSVTLKLVYCWTLLLVCCLCRCGSAPLDHISLNRLSNMRKRYRYRLYSYNTSTLLLINLQMDVYFTFSQYIQLNSVHFVDSVTETTGVSFSSQWWIRGDVFCRFLSLTLCDFTKGCRHGEGWRIHGKCTMMRQMNKTK